MSDATAISDDKPLELPVFTSLMDETPSPMSHDQATRAFDEMIQTFRLQESTPLQREEILPFVM